MTSTIPTETEALAAQLTKALVDRDEMHFKTVAFVNRHAIIAALSTPAARMPAGEVAQDLRSALEPYKHFDGPLPEYDSLLRPVYESGIQYAVNLLAETLNVTDWEVCDGTEEFDGDLSGTMFNIVLAAMPKNEDGDAMHPKEVCAALAQPAKNAKAGEGVAYLVRNRHGENITVRLATGPVPDGFAETPLYAHPPAAEPVDPELVERVRYAVDHPDAQGFLLAKASMTRHDFRRILAALSPAPDRGEVDPELIERLLDAQQDINFAANSYMDQSLCNASALIDEIEPILRTALKPADATPAEEAVQMAVPAGQCAHEHWSAMTMTGYMSCVRCHHTRPMTEEEARYWTDQSGEGKA